MNNSPSISESTRPDDRPLLQAWSRHRDEAAFTQFVQRHIAMVRGAALRKTGRSDLAEDIAQTVFALAARRAAALAGHPCAGAWLHRTAVLESANALRRESKQRKIAAAMLVYPDTSPVPGLPEAVLPHLDDALNSLPEQDRRAILLRFGERLSFDQMGARLGKSANACQKQTNRALDQLRGLLTKHAALSLTAVAAGLAHALSTSASAATAGYAATAAAAVKQASSLSTLTVISNTLATMALSKLTVTGAALAFLAPIGLHWSSGSAVPQSSPATESSAKTASPAPGPVPPNVPRDRSTPSASTRSAALARFAQELAKVTPPPADDRRLTELQRLVFALPDGELDQALQLLSTAPEKKVLGPVVSAIAARLAEADPAAALRTASGLPAELRLAAWSGALQVWARKDFDAAFAWVCAQPAGEDRNAQLDAVYEDLLGRDPAAALTRIPDVPTEAKRQLYRKWALMAWRHSDPDAALAWLTAHEPVETRASEINRFIGDWAANRPDLAVAYALRLVDNPHARRDTIRFSLMQWGMHDPAAAIACVVSLPPDMQTVDVARDAGAFIANGDLQGLLKASQNLPAGEFRDTLQEAVVTRLATTDLAQAREIAAGFTSKESRRTAAMAIGGEWMRRDAAAARAWIEASPDLSAESKAELLKPAAR